MLRARPLLQAEALLEAVQPLLQAEVLRSDELLRCGPRLRLRSPGCPCLWLRCRAGLRLRSRLLPSREASLLLEASRP